MSTEEYIQSLKSRIATLEAALQERDAELAQGRTENETLRESLNTAYTVRNLAMTKLEAVTPLPTDGATHWEGCWRHHGHHACAIAKLEAVSGPVTEGCWAVVGFYTQDIIGVCTDRRDVLAEEPKATFVPISRDDYESYGDGWDRAKRDAILAARAKKAEVGLTNEK